MVSVTHRFLLQSELCSMSGGYSGLDGDESYWYRRLKHASRTCFASSSSLSSFSPTFSRRVRRRVVARGSIGWLRNISPIFSHVSHRVRNRYIRERERERDIKRRSMNENTSSVNFFRVIRSIGDHARASIVFFLDKSLTLLAETSFRGRGR